MQYDQERNEWNANHPFFDYSELEFYGTNPDADFSVLDRRGGNRPIIWEKSTGRELGYSQLVSGTLFRNRIPEPARTCSSRKDYWRSSTYQSPRRLHPLGQNERN
jgi:hypothetical protein